LGIGTPGLIDFLRGSQVHWAVNLDWLDLPLRDLLERRYRVPVHVLNDSQAAAMGEYFFGTGHHAENLVVIKSEEGLGAGIVLEGRLVRGDQFGAGEIGHLVFGDDGRECRCGNAGCLETVASGAAIVQRSRAAATTEHDSAFRAAAIGDLALDMEEVRAAYMAGDDAIQKIVDDAARGLGLAIATLVGALNARNIVLTGPITRLGEVFLEAIRQQARARSLAALARDTRVEFSSLGSDITALGAAAMLLHEELGIWPLRRSRLAE
jgi:predicted NBD/HSP70 family sugar kinase